jgi:hypothetical protein
MSNEKKIGDINVTMGDGNEVGHIGHIFNFKEPAPSPNAMFQNNHHVGDIGSLPKILADGRYLIEEIYTGDILDRDQPFTLQGRKLKIEEHSGATSTRAGGAPRKTTIYNAICRLL